MSFRFDGKTSLESLKPKRDPLRIFPSNRNVIENERRFFEEEKRTNSYLAENDNSTTEVAAAAVPGWKVPEGGAEAEKSMAIFG